MKLTLGFITKGAALQVLRLYGLDYVGNLTYDKQLLHRRTQPSEPTPEIYRVDSVDFQVVLGVSPKHNFMQYWHGPEATMLGLVSRIVCQCKSPQAQCVIEMMGGSVATNCQVAMAVLAVATLKGGDRVAPMLLDMAKDGELS